MFRLLNALLPVLPAAVGAALVGALAFHPYRYRAKPGEARLLESGRQLRYGPGLKAWTWGPDGPVVMLVHGWGGAAVQWQRVVPALAARGYRVVAPDIAGHGLSAGRRIGFDLFADGVARVAEAVGVPLHALIGHSAGALGMMAARHLHSVSARRLVCIAAPSHPYPPIRVVQKKLVLPDAVVARFRTRLAAQFRVPWGQIESLAFSPAAGSELLLIYDQQDRYLDGADAARIRAHWPGSRLVLTTRLGHEQRVRADETIAAVLDFLQD